MSYQKLETEHIRLAILQVLQQDTDYAHNEHILAGALDQLGHHLSQDRLRAECHWLAELGLLEIDKVAQSVWVLRLARSGHDIATGRATRPGVARPLPI